MALLNRGFFPVDVNTAPYDMLLRVPGFGVKTVRKIVSSRRQSNLRYTDIVKLGANIKNAKQFMITSDWHPGKSLDTLNLRQRFVPALKQLEMFRAA